MPPIASRRTIGRNLQSIDPTNQLLARQNRVRVEAEVVRDLYLAVSGLLSEKVGGPSVFPPLPPGVAELSYANNFKWKTSAGEDRYRRGMYTFFKRTSPHPTLISFDCPDSNTTRVGRDISNTPLQALATLNNDVFAEAAQAWHASARRRRPRGRSTTLNYALRLCIASPTKGRGNRTVPRLADCSARILRSRMRRAPSKLAARHTANDVPAAENAAWIATVRMVMNLDEFHCTRLTYGDRADRTLKRKERWDDGHEVETSHNSRLQQQLATKHASRVSQQHGQRAGHGGAGRDAFG